MVLAFTRTQRRVFQYLPDNQALKRKLHDIDLLMFRGTMKIIRPGFPKSRFTGLFMMMDELQ